MNSPFGPYAQQLAVAVALAIVIAWLAMSSLVAVGVVAAVPPQLDYAFALVVGAVFATTATLNGVKSELRAIQTRLDVAGTPSASAARGGSVKGEG